jgi:hypothetical protein
VIGQCATSPGISGAQKKKDENGEDIAPKTGEDDVAVAAFRDSSFNKETQEGTHGDTRHTTHMSSHTHRTHIAHTHTHSLNF